MDLSQTLKEVLVNDRAEEARVKELLDLSAKKYGLERELESLRAKLTASEIVAKKLRNEVAALSFEVPVLEKQEAVVKQTVEESVRQLVAKASEVEQIQNSFWGQINDFVSDSNRLLNRADSSTNATDSGEVKRAEREAKLQLLKFESLAQAMQLYEGYQGRKIEELKLIKDLLGKNSLEI